MEAVLSNTEKNASKGEEALISLSGDTPRGVARVVEGDGYQNDPKNQCDSPPFLVVMSLKSQHQQPCQSYP